MRIKQSLTQIIAARELALAIPHPSIISARG